MILCKAGVAMAFVIQDNGQGTGTGFARRKEMEIACSCWFTAKGKMQPLMFKYQDEQGEIHTIKEIAVHSREDKNLLSSPQIEFDVTINCQGIEIRTQLVFYRKECRWTMVLGKE